MPNSRRLLLAGFGLLALVSGLTDDNVGYEFCEGDGSICEAFDGLDRTCNEKTGKAYYKCTCESGLVPVSNACDNCQDYFGDITFDLDDYYSSICASDGYTIAPMPSSILSSQKARNKTMEVPEYTQTSTFINTFTATPGFVSPYTTTLPALSSITLPALASATEPSSNGCDQSNPHHIAAICVAFVAGLMYHL
ncbi:hypothetical protein BGZ61DRAFT_358900 [Ilyonectria robusta]|uniref:uncharacterized protein n=1 Tax=Ilyonectria robusta TaxID=1079257 RepID=UPI001E8DA659|nr:uncharacterized protein BGZ61DRAFT_358900 [Ilyonectria robusta]KAH8680147.1 hypothetical protein BGZ61DRAFT_358900 [Ilyonectria robusta]